jgi:hypothetical protein
VGDAVPRVPPTDEVPVEAYKSKSEWIGWGGVKWCLEKDFKKLLNREGWQSGEPDAVAPRVYASFKFEPMKGSIGCPSHNVAKAVLSDVESRRALRKARRPHPNRRRPGVVTRLPGHA